MLNNSDVLIAVISGAYPNTLDKTLDVVRVFSTGRGQLPQEWSWPVFIPGSESVSIIASPEHRAIQGQFPAASCPLLITPMKRRVP
jgi:hypothetical protein